MRERQTLPRKGLPFLEGQRAAAPMMAPPPALHQRQIWLQLVCNAVQLPQV